MGHTHVGTTTTTVANVARYRSEQKVVNCSGFLQQLLPTRQTARFARNSIQLDQSENCVPPLFSPRTHQKVQNVKKKKGLQHQKKEGKNTARKDKTTIGFGRPLLQQKKEEKKKKKIGDIQKNDPLFCEIPKRRTFSARKLRCRQTS